MILADRFAAVVLCCSIGLCYSYQSYQDKIPNGDSVPNLCTTSSTDKWSGVGHEAVAGHGARNSFGAAFKTAGTTWTAGLCNADTDADGKTNGEELGDPDCTWTEGGTPSGSATGHPAICEPVTSDDCKTKNSWISSCPAADDNAAVGLTAANLLILAVVSTFLALFF